MYHIHDQYKLLRRACSHTVMLAASTNALLTVDGSLELSKVRVGIRNAQEDRFVLS